MGVLGLFLFCKYIIDWLHTCTFCVIKNSNFDLVIPWIDCKFVGVAMHRELLAVKAGTTGRTSRAMP